MVGPMKNEISYVAIPTGTSESIASYMVQLWPFSHST